MVVCYFRFPFLSLTVPIIFTLSNIVNTFFKKMLLKVTQHVIMTPERTVYLVKDRIKSVRESSGLSLRAFGSRIGISGASVARLESGENNPSERTIRLICSEFNVRRDWLLTGEEPMRLPPDEDDEIVDAVLAGENEFIKAVIRGIAKTPGGWEKMREVFNAIDAELKKNTPDA